MTSGMAGLFRNILIPAVPQAIARVVVPSAVEHKHLIRRYLGEIANEAGINEAEALADELMLLMEGAIVMAYVAGDHNAAGRARLGAQKLIQLALP